MIVKKGRKLTVEEVFNSLKNQTDNVSDNVLLAYANQIVQVNNNLLEEKPRFPQQRVSLLFNCLYTR